MRVLIVEDNKRLAESIRDILKHWYDCDICGDGSTGCCLLTDGGYDGAILDLMLPGMDGITLLKKARKSGCSVPVLILTARSEVEDRVLGLAIAAEAAGKHKAKIGLEYRDGMNCFYVTVRRK